MQRFQPHDTYSICQDHLFNYVFCDFSEQHHTISRPPIMICEQHHKDESNLVHLVCLDVVDETPHQEQVTITNPAKIA